MLGSQAVVLTHTLFFSYFFPADFYFVHRQCEQNSFRFGHTHTQTTSRSCVRCVHASFNPCLCPPHPRCCGDYPASHCIFSELYGALRFRESGKAPGTKSEREPSLTLARPTFPVSRYRTDFRKPDHKPCRYLFIHD